MRAMTSGMMMNWTIANGTHAIERVRFEFEFSEALTTKVIANTRGIIDEKISSGLLRFEPSTVRKVQQYIVDPAQPPKAIATPQGWEAIRKAAGGNIVEVIALEPQNLIYESADYRSWTKCKQRFETVCSEVLRDVLSVTDLKVLSHDYLDRFIFRGPPEQAVPSDIFSEKIVSALHDSARNGSHLWHVHRGWFQGEDNKLLLINQNIDAQEGQFNGMRARSVLVYTKCEWRVGQTAAVVDDVRESYDILHSVCNMIFSDCLTEMARNLVGISEGGQGRD